MTESSPSSSSEFGAEAIRGPLRERRPRTTYRLYRRYRLLSRLAALAGGALGMGLVAYSLVPILLAGHAVPTSAFVIAGAIVAVMAILPYAFVRWRWRVVRSELKEY